MRLTIHTERAVIRPTAHGTPFLGFVVYPTHRLLKRRKGVNYCRRLRQLLAGYASGKSTRVEVDASLRGWINHVRYGDTWGLRVAMLKEVRL